MHCRSASIVVIILFNLMVLFFIKKPNILEMTLNIDVNGLIRALNYGILRSDENLSIRKEAAKSLGIIKDPKAIKPLTRALSDKDPDIRKAAKKALQKIKG
jgi:HEAT repeat protein